MNFTNHKILGTEMDHLAAKKAIAAERKLLRSQRANLFSALTVLIKTANDDDSMERDQLFLLLGGPSLIPELRAELKTAIATVMHSEISWEPRQTCYKIFMVLNHNL